MRKTDGVLMKKGIIYLQIFFSVFWEAWTFIFYVDFLYFRMQVWNNTISKEEFVCFFGCFWQLLILLSISLEAFNKEWKLMPDKTHYCHSASRYFLVNRQLFFTIFKIYKFSRHLHCILFPRFSSVSFSELRDLSRSDPAPCLGAMWLLKDCLKYF